MSNIQKLLEEYGEVDTEVEATTPTVTEEQPTPSKSNIQSLMEEYSEDTATSPVKGSNIQSLLQEYPDDSGVTPLQGNSDVRMARLSSGKTVNITDELGKYDRSLTKEDILADDNLMDIVISSLESRYDTDSLAQKGYRLSSGLAGANVGGGVFRGDYRDMDKEDVFEIWQNYQRSFAGGQSVTTANEITYTLNADDETKARLGAGYMLFDKMDNAFTGEGTWAETGDAVFDYLRAGLYDPTTLLSLGVGKALGFGATKAAGLAARNAMIKTYQEAIKKGMNKTAARKLVGNAVAKAAPYTIAEAGFNVAADVAYQSQLIDTGAQEEFSKAQTAIAAAGSILLPAVVGTGKVVSNKLMSKETKTFYDEFETGKFKLTSSAALKIAKQRINKKKLFQTVNNNFNIQTPTQKTGTKKGVVSVDAVDAQFGKIKGKTSDFLAWEKIKAKATKSIEDAGFNKRDFDPDNAFLRWFWLGDPDGKSKGYFQALEEAGFALHKSIVEKHGKTGAFAQAVKFLPDAQVKKIITSFEKQTGLKLEMEKTAAGVAERMVKNASVGGETLWLSSQLTRMSNVTNKKAGQLLKDMQKGGEPKTGQFVLSTYKRLLTSHLSTTGANLKGFSQLVSLNTAADFFVGAINFGQSGLSKIVGDEEAAARYFNRSKGSIIGALERGRSVFDPELTYDYAKKMLELNPEAQEALFRDIAGDGGVNESFKSLNLDPNNKLYAGVDAVTKGIQTATAVRLQDDLTKTWAFGTNVNQAIRREYGMSPEKFFEDKKKASIEMATKRFRSNVLEKAVFRTQRETASVNWSTLPANTSMRATARFIETLTNKSPLGFIVPFGSFFNTTVATMADLSGVNAMRFAYKNLTGQQLDYATQEGAEAFGRMAAGWTAVGFGVYGFGGSGGAIERVEQGLSWNQERRSDGSLEDRTFDWPASTMRVTAQILAHGVGRSDDFKSFDPSQVPEELWSELGRQLGGQAIRDLKDFDRSLLEYGKALFEIRESKTVTGEFAGPTISKFVDFTEDLIGPPAARIIQGSTRPLEPVNIMYGLLSDKDMTPDLRQGPETFNSAVKYFNNLFPSTEELPARATPTRGLDQKLDVGKQVLGVRTSREPNMIERMLNSAGQPLWNATGFDGPPEIKNYLDGIAGPIINNVAKKYLKKNPDFFKMKLEDKEKILEVIKKEAKANVTDFTKSSRMPKTFEMVRVLTNKDKDKVKRIMNFMGIEGELEDLLKEEDGLQKLKTINNLLENYDSIFNRELELK